MNHFSVDARDNTSTNHQVAAGVPIYNLAGQLVASNNNNLWNSYIQNPINVDENGDTTSRRVWTGTTHFGLGDGSHALSGPQPNRTSLSDQIDGDWIANSTLWLGYNFSNYAISGILTSTVPIPTAAWLFGSALIGLVGIKRKK